MQNLGWHLIEGPSAAPEADSTVVVIGNNERAVAAMLALVRELGWSAPQVRFPYWSDGFLHAAIAANDGPPMRALIRQRYQEAAHWLVRAQAEDERFAAVLPSLRDTRYIVLVDNEQLIEQAASGTGTAATAWQTGLPQWLASEACRTRPTLLVAAQAAIELHEELVAALTTFAAAVDPGRIACAAAWVRMYRLFPDLPLGEFKVNGTIDRATPTSCGGWAYIEGVDAPVEMAISVNGETRIVRADSLRPDLANRGFHKTGLCGYNLSFVGDILVMIADSVHVRVVGDARELINSPALAQNFDLAKKKSTPPPSALLGEDYDDFGRDLDESKGPRIEMPDFGRLPPRSPILVLLNTLWALLLRDMRARFGTRRGDFVLGILEPALQIVVLSAIVRGFKGRFNGTLYGEEALWFFALGIIPFQMFSQAMSGGKIKAGSGLFSFRQIRPVDVSLATAFMDFAVLGVIMMLLIGIANWFGYPFTIDQPLRFMQGLFLLFWLGLSIGLFFDVLIIIIPAAAFVQSLMVKALYITSGVIFPIHSLPTSIQQYLYWNPVLHVIEELRASGIVAYPYSGDLFYTGFFTLASVFIALAFYRRNLFRLF